MSQTPTSDQAADRFDGRVHRITRRAGSVEHAVDVRVHAHSVVQRGEDFLELYEAQDRLFAVLVRGADHLTWTKLMWPE